MTKRKPADKPRRGRPRSEEARVKIIEAARAIIEERGVGAVTVEEVAARAGVGKPTIYRTWPNAQAVAMAALIETAPAETATRETKAALDDLRRQLRRVAAVFATRTGRHVTTLIAHADRASELSRVFRNHFIMTRREEGRAMLARAMAKREIRADIDVDAALDMIYAPIFFRLLLGHLPLDARFTDAVLDQALNGLSAKRR